jgi:hypothetical protein
MMLFITSNLKKHNLIQQSFTTKLNAKISWPLSMPKQGECILCMLPNVNFAKVSCINYVLERIVLKCHMIYIDKSQLRIVWIATNHKLIKQKFSLGKISDIIYLGKSFFGRFSFEYTSGQIYIARNFFLQSNTRVCRSKLSSGWRPRVIFLLQTLMCQDCSKKFPAIYSRGQNKVGQCFFANVNLLALSMVTMKIFIYLL